MADIKKLREQMANAATEARSLLDQAEAEKDEARAKELEAQHDAAMADYDRLEAQVARAERMARIEADQDEAREAEERARRENKRPGTEPRTDDGKRGDVTYGDAFMAYLRAGGDMSELDGEARAMLKRGETELRAQTTANAAGGYTIPEDFLPKLIKSMAMWGPMYDGNVVTEMVTSGGASMPIPTVNDTASTAGAHTEGATLTDDGGKDVTFGQKTLDAYEFDTEWVRMSKALLDDSVLAIQTVIADLLGERLGRLTNTQLTTGTGSSAPNGVVTASTAGKTAAGTAAITSDEIMDLLHSVDPAYRMGPKVGFMFNDATLAAIRKLKDGDGNYLWQMGNVQQGAPGTLLGYRYHINQAMDSLAAAKKVMLFGDFGKYYVRKVGGPLIAAIQDKDFWPGAGIAGYIRFDGELTDAAAIKHLITAAS